MIDKISHANKLFHEVINLLPCIYDDIVTDEYKETYFVTDSNQNMILSTNENAIETLADLFDQLYGTSICITGYYDPVEDERNNEVDAYTGMYYLLID